MPPLANLSMGQQQVPIQQSYQSPTSPQQFYQNTSPAPAAPMSPAAEAHIQSWAREDDAQPPEQPQPRPMAPLQGMWQPDMGIKFAGPGGGGGGGSGGQGSAPQGGSGPVGGKWEPGSAIRFG